MKCAACHGGVPPGKVLFCPACFSALPRKEQGACVSHYVRVCKAAGHPVTAEHPSMTDKVAKLAKLIRAARGLPEPTEDAGLILVDAPRQTDTMREHRAAIRAALSNPLRS